MKIAREARFRLPEQTINTFFLSYYFSSLSLFCITANFHGIAKQEGKTLSMMKGNMFDSALFKVKLK